MTTKNVLDFIVFKYTSSGKKCLKRMKYCGDMKNYIINIIQLKQNQTNTLCFTCHHCLDIMSLFELLDKSGAVTLSCFT